MSDPLEDNIRRIIELERQAARDASTADRIGTAISNTIGTLAFVIAHVAVLAIWLGWNVAAPAAWRFDPYPFGLLTFIVSLEGVLIACFVLIAQNRLARLTDRRDHLNLQVSLLAEQEMTVILKLLRQVSERLDVSPQTTDEARVEQLSEETNVYELVQKLEEELPPKSE